MQWIIEALKANSDTEGKVDLDKFESAVKTEFPKNAVPKDQYNTVADKLKSANDTIDTLQKENKDVTTLQKQIDDYKTQVAEKEKQLVETRNSTTLKEALREAGATDIDYMKFKLGELETDAEGNYKDLESRIKSLKESSPKWFESDKSDKGDKKDKSEKGNVYKPIDNGLKDGKPSEDTKVGSLSEAIADHYNQKD